MQSSLQKISTLLLNALSTKRMRCSETDSSAVVNLINKILREAVEGKISDIHFEPQDDELIVRFREDGTLHEKYRLPATVSRQLTNRLKTMSELDVNISKTIQDGN